MAIAGAAPGVTTTFVGELSDEHPSSVAATETATDVGGVGSAAGVAGWLLSPQAAAIAANAHATATTLTGPSLPPVFAG